jgi:hypothetical protein
MKACQTPVANERRAVHNNPDSVRPLSRNGDATAFVTLAAHMQTKLWINAIDKGIENYEEMLDDDDPLTDATRKVLQINRKRRQFNKDNGHNGQGQLPDLNDLDVLVICGQLTACYKLMLHSLPRNRVVFDKASALWARLSQDPASLVDERRAWAAG